MISGFSSYSEYIKNCQAFNKRIGKERRHRLPFLDPQTGIAQSPSNLWRDKRERLSSNDPQIVYTYPASRWRRRKSNFNIYTTDVRSAIKTADSVDGAANDAIETDQAGGIVSSGSIISSNSAKNSSDKYGMLNTTDSQSSFPRVASDGGASSTAMETKSTLDQTWYDDLSDQQVDDYEDPSDGDDYEEMYVKKKPKKAKKATGEKKRRPNDIPDSEKPYICQHCGAKYKTKPGLHYHLTHVHANEVAEEKERALAEAQASAAAAGGYSPRATIVPVAPPPAPPPMMPMHQQHIEPPYTSAAHYVQRNPGTSVEKPRHIGKGQSEPNLYCDFCLGDASDNKKTNLPEELINCSDCGRAGHPTCLQFTANMIISTKKHGWQCIECKSCAICGTSENDEQLLFCDDCDRGFHMYCLRPPLSAPPEGNWSCHLCVVEFGQNASRPAMVPSGVGLGHMPSGM